MAINREGHLVEVGGLYLGWVLQELPVEGRRILFEKLRVQGGCTRALPGFSQRKPAPDVSFELCDPRDGIDLFGQPLEPVGRGRRISSRNRRSKQERLSLDQQHVGIVRIYRFRFVQKVGGSPPVLNYLENGRFAGAVRPQAGEECIFSRASVVEVGGEIVQ